MSTIGFLHTADVHRATFTTLVGELAPDARTVHVVDTSLLAEARAQGTVDDALRARLLTALREVANDSDVVVCTCSTISGEAEALANLLDVPIIRIDRPMAEKATACGSRLAVVAALASTIAPTTALLREVADSRGVALQLSEYVCRDAWIHFEAGDTDRYRQAIVSTIDAIPGPVDAIVLAQASMASAAGQCRSDVPVLSSPRLAVEHAVQVIGV